MSGRGAGDLALRNEAVATRARENAVTQQADEASSMTAHRWRSTGWIAAVVAVFGFGGIVDWGIAERWAETSSEQALENVAARIAVGIRGSEGRVAVDRSAVSGRGAQRGAIDPVRYVVRTDNGDYVAGDAGLGADRWKARIVAVAAEDAPVQGHAFSKVIERNGRTFVVTVQENDDRRRGVAWSFFKLLMMPTLVLPGAFALFAWLILRNEHRSLR